MKRAPQLGLALAILLGPAMPAQAATPTYAFEWTVFPAVFVDEIAVTIPSGDGRRQAWRDVRDRVLEAYQPIGFRVDVVEQLPQERPVITWTTDNGAVYRFQDPDVVPACQIVGSFTTATGYGMTDDEYAPNAATLGLTWPQGLRRQGPGWIRQYFQPFFAHELAHVLGLAHGSDPSSVTSGGVRGPSPADLEALSGPEAGLPDPADAVASCS